MKTNYIKGYILILFSVTCLTLSCSKQTNVENDSSIDIPEGYAAIKIEMADIHFQEEKLGDTKKATVKINNTKSINSVESSLTNNGISCSVSLEPVSEISSNNVKSLVKGNNKFAALQTKEVDKGTHYRVYAYDKATGALATSKNYIRGQESTIGPLLILGGKEYTIVAYSIDSKTEFPAEIENASNISTATITNAQVSFMFQRQENIAVANNSTNTIKLKFKHQFAQINTIIKLDATTSEYTQIRGVGGASYFKPSYSKTKFKVSDSKITAAPTDENILGSPVTFPFIPFTDLTVKTTASINPTILNTPSTITEGKFTIEALTIGDVSRRVDISDLNLLPGVKYNLVLTLNVPETTLIGVNPYFKFYDVTTQPNNPFKHTVTLENPTFGANIDIWFLDNSFNLNINGNNLFSRELNFEGLSSNNNQGRHDVFFSDNTYYNDAIFGTGNIDYVFRINNTTPRQEIPVVRLTFDQNGNVRLFGRKRMSENLRELFIRPGVTINPLARLIPNGNNTLIFSSTRWTITDVEGRIYGIRTLPPNPTTP